MFEIKIHRVQFSSECHAKHSYYGVHGKFFQKGDVPLIMTT